MSIHREGFRIILITTLLLALINFGVYSWLGEGIIFNILLILSLVFYVLVVQFFRNPSRETPLSSGHIIAPADGKVVVDGNHPWAGERVIFTATVTDVRKAIPEEISHQHVHGAGGHHH